MPTQPIPTPFECEIRVKPEWIDPNGHMNIAAYVTAFDEASDHLLAHVDLGWDSLLARGRSTFVLGMNLDFQREAFAGDPLRIASQLLDWDHKRVHFFHSMFHATQGFRIASNELLFVHVSMADRRSAPMPDEVQQALARMAAAHASLRLPEGAYRTLGIRRRP